MSDPDITKGKKRRRSSRRVISYINENKPRASRAEFPAFPGDDDDDSPATGAHEVARAHVGKAPGNPVSGFPDPSDRQVNSRELAFQHPNLRQHSTDVQPFGRFGNNRVTYLGQSAFSGEFSDSDAPPGADLGRVRVQSMDFAGQAGSYVGMNPGDDNPGRRPLDFRMAPQSATPANGSHSLADPVSHAVACKSALDIMRETQRRI